MVKQTIHKQLNGKTTIHKQWNGKITEEKVDLWYT